MIPLSNVSQLGRMTAISDLNADLIPDALIASRDATSSDGIMFGLKGGIPYALAFSPRAEQRSVPTDQMVTITCFGIEENINTEQFFLSIDDVIYQSGDPEVLVEQVGEFTTITVQPEDPFEIDVPIPVEFQATPYLSRLAGLGFQLLFLSPPVPPRLVILLAG